MPINALFTSSSIGQHTTRRGQSLATRVGTPLLGTRTAEVDLTDPAETARAEMQRVLRRYGVRCFSCVRDDATGRITVRFVVPEAPTADAEAILVQVPIDVRRVYASLYGRSRAVARLEHGEHPNGDGQQGSGTCYDSQRLEHAERAAWRHLLQWVEGALAAASAGLVTIAEAFFAYRVVTFDDGGPGRLVDYLEAEQSYLGAAVRALLSTPVESAPA